MVANSTQNQGSQTKHVQEYESSHLLRGFDKWVALSPQRCAIIFKDEEVSYADLSKRSLRLALRLKDHGVGRESIVPFCLPKSIEAIVAMLAIIRCGAAYAAILPSAPMQRKREIVEACGSGSEMLICDDLCSERLCQTQIIIGNEEGDDSFGRADKNSNPSDLFASPNTHDAACVLFTSGSTGKPKGVIYEHGHIIFASDRWGPYLGIGPETRMLQWCAFTFDVSIVETIVSLARGACICLPSEEERPERTEDFVNRVRANFAFFTPSVARTLIPARMPGLKTVVLGGEGTSRDIVSRWWQGRRLINSYGPCECTIWFSFAEVECEEAAARNVGIPDPAYNKGYVVSLEDPNVLLSERGGVVGELLIEGFNVVRGYLNDQVRSSASASTSLGILWNGAAMGHSRSWAAKTVK